MFFAMLNVVVFNSLGVRMYGALTQFALIFLAGICFVKGAGNFDCRHICSSYDNWHALFHLIAKLSTLTICVELAMLGEQAHTFVTPSTEIWLGLLPFLETVF
eukprot:TRINITY_DN1888_c0_g1_i2.p1 TRINITY_DN1888_c0_g1~~TRINITY_DN1888_c0_g1_i2.p1  ORF type:complete len:103 (-),score=7.00 TRINITY_DN1888_c0_g1_i2:29-337(-)